MNAGGVSKACKSKVRSNTELGKRESNTLVICPEDVNNSEKFEIIHDGSGGSYDIPT